MSNSKMENIMGYLAAWKVLEEMIADMRKKAVAIPDEILSDLKSAKTLISILKADPSRIDTSQKIEEYLLHIESYVVSAGQKFGQKYVDGWLKRLDEASVKPHAEEESEEETRFIPGLPREKKWIRVKPTAELSIERIRALAEESALSCSVQNDGFLLFYGKDEAIKEFVKKMATEYGFKAEK